MVFAKPLSAGVDSCVIWGPALFWSPGLMAVLGLPDRVRDLARRVRVKFCPPSFIFCPGAATYQGNSRVSGLPLLRQTRPMCDDGPYAQTFHGQEVPRASSRPFPTLSWQPLSSPTLALPLRTQDPISPTDQSPEGYQVTDLPSSIHPVAFRHLPSQTAPPGHDT